MSRSDRFGRAPAFAAIVVITLALGIGANTAIFAVVNGVLLRPLPYEHPESLVVPWSHSPGIAYEPDGPFSTGMYHEIKDCERVFEQVGILKSRSATLIADGAPEHVSGAQASASLLPLLGARPTLGRLFAPDEDTPAAPRTVILSHALWQRRFGSSHDVLGKTLQIDGVDHTIVGVLEKYFAPTREYLPMLRGSARIDYWVPLVCSTPTPTISTAAGTSASSPDWLPRRPWPTRAPKCSSSRDG